MPKVTRMQSQSSHATLCCKKLYECRLMPIIWVHSAVVPQISYMMMGPCDIIAWLYVPQITKLHVHLNITFRHEDVKNYWKNKN